MNGVHDMGGMQDMGPVRREKGEPVFHAPWERRMFALFNASDTDWPTRRREIESIAPDDYLRMSYYERWLAAIEPLMTKAGMLTPEEIASGKVIGGTNNRWHVLSAADVATRIAPSTGSSVAPTAKARFQVSQRVYARNINPLGHTRLPRYARGKVGIITRINSVHALEDNVAAGLPEKPQHVYTVRFAARDLWGEVAGEHDAVYADLWEEYLEPA